MTITMQKLLDLLYNYKPIFQTNTKYVYDNKSIWVKEYEYNGTSISTRFDEIILSKKFGFIKWLVEENKIDHGLLSNTIIKSNIFDNIADLSESDCLIMLLSIEDDPIIFLSSLLK